MHGGLRVQELPRCSSINVPSTPRQADLVDRKLYTLESLKAKNTDNTL
jgi:hypothetical protein